MNLTNQNIEIMAETYKILGDYTRLRILLTCIDGKISVGELAEKLDISQSLTSHHIRLLKAARLIIGTRKNKQIIYQAADGHVTHMIKDMIDHISEED